MARPLDEAAPVRTEATSVGSLSRTGLLLLIALTVTWGLNWPMMKLALADIPVWTFRTLCLMVGGGTLLLLTRLAGYDVALPRHRLGPLCLVALFNITGWHICSAYGLLHTGSGRAAIIGYTMPLFASLLSVPILGLRPTGRQMVALMLGMAALVALIAQDLQAVGGAPLGVLLMSLAALSWAIGTILVKKIDWGGMPVMALTGWQQLIGGVPIVIGWLILEPVPDVAAIGWPALIGLGYAIFVAMVFCHTAYFELVRLLPAHVAAMGTLAVPVVGVVTSAWILGEAVGLTEVTALLLVVSALFLLIRRG